MIIHGFFYIGNYAISLLIIFCLKNKCTIPDLIVTSFFYGLAIYFLVDYSILIRQVTFVLIDCASFYYSEKTILQAVIKAFLLEPLQQFSTTVFFSVSSLYYFKNSTEILPVLGLLIPTLLSCGLAVSISSLDRQLTALANINNLPVKSIIYTKLQLANIQGIEFSIEVLDLIQFDDKYVASIVRILGIFLDNAIEALNELGHGLLSVAFFKIEDNVHIVIQNDFNLSSIQSILLFEKEGYSTKGKDRGLGLSNVKDLLKNKPILLDTSISENKFIQELIILPKGARA